MSCPFYRLNIPVKMWAGKNNHEWTVVVHSKVDQKGRRMGVAMFIVFVYGSRGLINLPQSGRLGEVLCTRR